MANEHLLIITASSDSDRLVDPAVLKAAGYRVTTNHSLGECEATIKSDSPDAIILVDCPEALDVFHAASILNRRYPFIPLVLIPEKHSDDLAVTAFRAGFSGYVRCAAHSDEVLQSIYFVLERRKLLEDHARTFARDEIKSFQRKFYELEMVERVGRQVASTLDLEQILVKIVDAAVELTGAEEGSILLPDENTGELFIRASRNFQEDFVKTFRLPIQESLAGKVLQTGEPILLDEKKPQKIKTTYLVHNLIYMPIKVDDRVIGVLEVDNRQSGKPFSENHLMLLSAISGYAGVAIENAHLFARTEMERLKLERILSEVENGVIVVDFDGRLILVNAKAREAFRIDENMLAGKRLSQFIQNQDLLDVLRDDKLSASTRIEITLEDGRVLNVQVTPVPQAGYVIIMHDITHLKELDRIKTEFVNTVSHDLRSPLTAILGYTELIDRVGPVNKKQQEFIRRVQLSVHSITALINDLLDLGRIETGFDARKELIPFSTLLDFSVDGLRNRARDKSQSLILDAPTALPHVLGNPIRLRQMMSNLLGNAIKYTQENGEIRVKVEAEAGQIIMQISDNGPGIPPADLPFIFDKFYRASNIPSDIPGSGLGLAIVKSIVENHLGRIWVDSTLEQGTSFTVVLPSVDSEF